MKIQFSAESGCKANGITRYKVDTACRVLTHINFNKVGLVAHPAERCSAGLGPWTCDL